MTAHGEPPRILLVEDDRETRRLIADVLKELGHDVTVADRCAAATAALRGQDFSAIVLDVRLPDGDGIALCREWRTQGIEAPILILTARTDVASRVAGLNSGADDYLGKPFAVAELRARVTALLRRGTARSRERTFQWADLIIDLDRRSVRKGGEEVPLTRREFELLKRLIQAGGHAVSRVDLMDDVWGEATPEVASSLEVIIGRLRRKLDSPGEQGVIQTFRGFGYSFAAPEGKTR